jgi:uncharacterized spore protein YtfJ
MSSPVPFAPIGEILEKSLNIHHVYGEPVQRGDTTVIPVAQVAYGFGAGGGRGPGSHRMGGHEEGPAADAVGPDAQGAGGGGGVRMSPIGALEIGPRGIRFVRIHALAPLLSAAALGVAVGWLISRRT